MPPRIITPCANLQEARWLGFEANMRHGLPLRPKLLKPALHAYLDAGKHRSAGGRLQSYRGIAKALPGLFYSTIRRYIETGYPALFVEMGGQDSGAVGGAQELPQAMTPEECILAEGRARIADAGALLRSLPGELRRLVAGGRGGAVAGPSLG